MNSAWRKKEQGEKAVKRMEEQVNTATVSLNRCIEEKQSTMNDLTEMQLLLIPCIMQRVKYNLLSDEYSSLEKKMLDLPTANVEMSAGAKEHEDFANRIRHEKARLVVDEEYIDSRMSWSSRKRKRLIMVQRTLHCSALRYASRFPIKSSLRKFV